MKNQKIRRLIIWLHKNFQADLPIKVRSKYKVVRNNESLYALCTRYDQYIKIEYDKTVSEALIIDALIHEWAHALSLTDSSRKEHPQSFGIAYSKVYDAYDKWNFGKAK